MMGINSLFSLVKKDLKILWRSKFSAMMILLTPVLIILLAGTAFNSSGISGVVLGVYSESYSDLSSSILNSLEENNFAINKFEFEKDCMDSVKLSKTQICIVFSDNLTETNNVENIIFYVDHSRINLAHSLIYYIENEISLKSSNISISLTQGLIDNLKLAKNSLAEQQTKLTNSIIEINKMDEKIEDFSSNSEISTAINYLNDAKDQINESEPKAKVDETIILLQNIETFNSENSENLNNQNEEILFLIEDASNKLNTLIYSLEQSGALNSEEIVSPINIQINSLNADSNNRNYLLPTILALIVLFGGILLSSTFVLKERKTKAFFRNFITPTRDFTFIISCFFTSLIILIGQFIIIFIGIEYILKIPLLGILPEISLILFVAFAAFISIGMFIGYLFKSEETTIFASVIIAAALMFFSNTILPLESISSSFKIFANFNPFVVLDLALKKVILFGFSYSSILSELAILGCFFVVFIFLAYIGRRITRRML